MKKKRNNIIDFLRGCACICIVLIHTAWWSGETYLPKWFSSLFLFLDVPLFMFISGITYNYIESVGKNIKGILKLWNKWIFFLIIYLLAIVFIFKSNFNYTNIVRHIFFQVPQYGPLKVVGGSIWFITMYIKVTLFCSILLYFYNKNRSSIEFKYIIMFLVLLSMLNDKILDNYTIIYSIIYLLGYYSYNNKIKDFERFMSLEVSFIIFNIALFIISGYKLTDLQILKFPPTINYLLASMPSIILVWYIKDIIKKSPSKVIDYIGENAIFFFFAQGISSSLLFFIKINISNVYLLFIIMFIINLIMDLIIGFIIKELYDYVVKSIHNLIKKLE